MHAADCEVGLAHFVGQPVHLAPSVAEDNGLSDGKGIVEVAKRVELPLLLFDGDEVLLQSFEGQLVTLDENAHGVGHELGGHVEHIVGEGGRNHNDLGRGRKVSVHIVDLFPESLVKEFVGFIEDKHLDVTSSQVTTTDHVGHTTGSSRNDVLAVVELADILANVCASNTSMALHVHVVAKRHDNTLNLGRQFTGRGQDQRLCLADSGIDDLEHADGEGRRLSGTRLGLRNGVSALADLHDGTRLNSRWRLIAVGIDSAKKALCRYIGQRRSAGKRNEEEGRPYPSAT